MRKFRVCRRDCRDALRDGDIASGNQNDARSAPHKRACRLDQCIEHGLQIESRAADDLEHIGSGGLLLQRFAQLVEQPRVLDGDDGLSSEVLDQLDLLIGERADLLTIDGELRRSTRSP